MKSQLLCKRPDRDIAKMVCGYPLPCPHHTYTLEPDGSVVVPPSALTPKRRVLRRLRNINRVVRRQREEPTDSTPAREEE